MKLVKTFVSEAVLFEDQKIIRRRLELFSQKNDGFKES
jgi:hypothetical protein